MNQKMKVYSVSSFVLAVLILIAYHLLAYIGHYGYDDMQYAFLAHQWTEGVFDAQDHFSFRTTLLAFTSLFYQLFGISDTTSSWPSLIQGIAILYLVYRVLKKQGSHVLFVGLILTVLSPWFLFYSDKLMSDIYLALGFFGAIVMVYLRRHSSQSKKALSHALLFVAFMAYAFMSKGTIVLIIPLLLYYFISDILKKQELRFWIYSIAFGLLFLLGYAVLSKYFTGSYVQRFIAIAQNAYLNACSYNEQPLGVLLRRIAYQFWELMIYQGLMIPFLVVIPYALQKKLKFEGNLKFWVPTALILLLSSNFFSISASSYSPMCLDPRHYLFLIPVGAITAALILKHIGVKSLHQPLYAVWIVGVCLSSYFMQDRAFAFIYLPLLIVYAISFVIQNKKVLIGLGMVALLIQPVHQITYAQGLSYAKQKEYFIQLLDQAGPNSVIICNTVQSRLAAYYQSFQKEEVAIIAYSDFDPEVHKHQKVYLFKNAYTQYLSGTQATDLPYYVQHLHPKNKLLFKDVALQISAYEMSHFQAPETIGKLFISDTLAPNKPSNYWELNPEDVQLEDSLWVLNVSTYSASFKTSLDAIMEDSLSSIDLICQLQFARTNESNAQMVMVVKNTNENYIWEGQGIQHQVKSAGSFWPVQTRFSIPISKIKKDSEVQIYLWNPDGDLIQIKDFNVQVFGMRYL